MLAELLLRLRRECRGREHALKAPALAALLGISTRQLRELAREARREGHPVCADAAGYYYAATDQEYQHLRASLRSRAFDMVMTCRMLDQKWPQHREPVQTAIFQEVPCAKT